MADVTGGSDGVKDFRFHFKVNADGVIVGNYYGEHFLSYGSAQEAMNAQQAQIRTNFRHVSFTFVDEEIWDNNGTPKSPEISKPWGR